MTYQIKSEVSFITGATSEEVKKISSWVKYANKMINDHFGIVTSFDVLICRGRWEMEVQVISRRSQSMLSMYNDTRFVGITDYRLEEIVIRCDIARFGHYLHELIHGIISKTHPHQLREGLAWYFTLKLTEEYRYVRPSYPSWVDVLYVYPVNRLAEIVGDEFLKDIAVGKASVQYDLLPRDVQDLFVSEEVYYSKKRYHE
ncbi:MAG TPA: hypothetical protein VJ799_10380 [Nitrososphaeraceae archaeon]|nr:hypothetical protein [Nitrososphaeraceae archaeon]